MSDLLYLKVLKFNESAKKRKKGGVYFRYFLRVITFEAFPVEVVILVIITLRRQRLTHDLCPTLA